MGDERTRWPVDRPPEIGSSMCGLWDYGLYFRVPDHPQFDDARVYRAVALEDFGPAATAQVFFITDRGYLWAVPQNRCVCVVGRASAPIRDEQRRFKLPDTPPESDWERGTGDG